MAQTQQINYFNPWAVKDTLAEHGVLVSLSLVSEWSEEDRWLAIECVHLLPTMGTDRETAGVLAQIKYERRRLGVAAPPLAL